MGHFFRLLTVALMLVIFIQVPAYSKERLLAKGDGIELTAGDVSRVIGHFAEMDIFVQQHAELQGTLRLRLFAEEALALGLDSDLKEVDPMDVDQIMNLRNKYLKHIMEEFPVSALVVESYYHAHPERFEHQGVPLDRDTREQISWIVRRANLQKLQDKAYEKLLEKYDVVFCDAAGGCE